MNSKKEILVSVIVITYNQESYIKRAIETVLNQQGDFCIELIISNDASPDNTSEIVHRCITENNSKHKILYYEQSKNLGIVENCIFTLTQCSGEYVAICEGDDYWTDTSKIQKQLNCLLSNPSSSFVFCNRTVLNPDGTSWEEQYDQFHHKTVFDSKDIINGFIPGTVGFFWKNDPGLISFLKSHSHLKHADQYIAYYFSCSGPLLLIPENLATYKMTGHGAWSKNDSLKRLQVKAAQLYDFHKNIGLDLNSPILQFHLVKCMWICFKYCCKRPIHFLNKQNLYWIIRPWKKWPLLSNCKQLLSIIKNG